VDAAHTGAVRIELAGPRTLRYDWAALSRLRTALGKEYEQRIAAAMAELDTATLAEALACGLEPAMSPAEIQAASPPLVETVRALERALKYAYYGGEEPANEPEDPPQGLRGLTGSLRRFGSRLAQALTLKPSGG